MSEVYIIKPGEKCRVCDEVIRVFEGFVPAKGGIRHARCEEDE